jgi:hypothetical protein
MSVFAGPNVVTNGLGFSVDFYNTKSISETTLTNMSTNNIPVSLTNSNSNTLTITNGYADFNPSTLTSTSTFYTISNTYFNDIKNEITLETCMWVYQNFGNDQYVRGVSTRTTETGSPLGFSIGASSISTEINTSNGWNTAVTSSVNVGYNKWVYISQTTSATSGKFITYVNSINTKEQSFTGTISGGNGILIGRGFYGGICNYSGRVSFVRVYSRALSSQEIQQNFNATRSRFGV